MIRPLAGCKMLQFTQSSNQWWRTPLIFNVQLLRERFELELGRALAIAHFVRFLPTSRHTSVFFSLLFYLSHTSNIASYSPSIILALAIWDHNHDFVDQALTIPDAWTTSVAAAAGSSSLQAAARFQPIRSTFQWAGFRSRYWIPPILTRTTSAGLNSSLHVRLRSAGAASSIISIARG